MNLAPEPSAGSSGLLATLLHLVFPPLCVVCRQGLGAGSEAELCAECRGKITELPLPDCPRCGAPREPDARCTFCLPPPVYLDGAASAWLYEGVAADVLLAYKFRSRRQLVRLLAPALVEAVDRRWPDLPFTAVLPVPLHPWRERRREFNQSALLAEHLCAVRGLHLLGNAAVRVRRTRPQSALGAHARRAKNIAGAFAVVDPAAIAGGAILIIDDILTTGATANELARVLKEAGAKKVMCATVARAPRHRKATPPTKENS